MVWWTASGKFFSKISRLCGYPFIQLNGNRIPTPLCWIQHYWLGGENRNPQLSDALDSLSMNREERKKTWHSQSRKTLEKQKRVRNYRNQCQNLNNNRDNSTAESLTNFYSSFLQNRNSHINLTYVFLSIYEVFKIFVMSHLYFSRNVHFKAVLYVILKSECLNRLKQQCLICM